MKEIDKIFEDWDEEEYQFDFQFEDNTFFQVDENSLNKNLPSDFAKYIKTMVNGDILDQYERYNIGQSKTHKKFYISIQKNYANGKFSWGWMPLKYNEYNNVLSGYDFYIKDGYKFIGKL